MSETFKKIVIKGEEIGYLISDFGNVISLKTGVEVPRKIIKNRDGYFLVGFSYKNKQFGCSVHRLVALHFIPNPNNYREVNHIDGDKTNNHVSNLEWCSRSQNIAHAYKNGFKTNPKGINGVNSKPIGRFKDGKLVKMYECLLHVKNDGFSCGHTSVHARNGTKTYDGYEWKFLDIKKEANA